MVKNGMRPVHPGEILREEFLAQLEMPVDDLAVALRLPPATVADVVHERHAMSADTALRLSRFFGTTPEFWLNLQMAYDLRKAVIDGWESIEKEIKPFDKT